MEIRSRKKGTKTPKSSEVVQNSPKESPHVIRHGTQLEYMASKQNVGVRAAFLEDIGQLGVKDVEGFIVLAFIFLSLLIIQTTQENIHELGFLANPSLYIIFIMELVFAGLIYLYCLCLSLVVLLAQKWLSRDEISPWQCNVVYVTFQVVLFSGNLFTLFARDVSPLVSFAVMCFTFIIAFKTHSFHFTNMELYHASHRQEQPPPEAVSKVEDFEGVGMMASYTARALTFISPLTKHFMWAQAKKVETQIVAAKNTNEVSEKVAEFYAKIAASYPSNLSFVNFMDFLFIPTLVYRLWYPRTEKTRWIYVVKECTQALGCFIFFYFLVNQFLLPVFADFERHEKLEGVEFLWGFVFDLIRIATPGMICWLLMFYAVFHCFFNALSEVVCYGDRHFYQDWWNSVTIDDFWRKWNVPVYEFFHRHIYWESIKKTNVTRNAAGLLVFGMSAVMHEVLMLAAFKVFRPIFFFGMVAQVPGIYVSKVVAKKSRVLGNLMMWSSLIIGQPIMELMYVRSYFLKRTPAIAATSGELFWKSRLLHS